MRPLLARCYLGLGSPYGSGGRDRSAREHLLTASAMFRDMGMQWWAEKAESELNALNRSA
jgi:hypothetical protein